MTSDPLIFTMDNLALTNSVEPAERPHNAAFHLGFHCFFYPFKSFSYTKGKRLLKQTGEAEDRP